MCFVLKHITRFKTKRTFCPTQEISQFIEVQPILQAGGPVSREFGEEAGRGCGESYRYDGRLGFTEGPDKCLKLRKKYEINTNRKYGLCDFVVVCIHFLSILYFLCIYSVLCVIS